MADTDDISQDITVDDIHAGIECFGPVPRILATDHKLIVSAEDIAALQADRPYSNAIAVDMIQHYFGSYLNNDVQPPAHLSSDTPAYIYREYFHHGELHRAEAPEHD